jgi:hypothetical protein
LVSIQFYEYDARNHEREENLIGCGASGTYAPGPDEEEEEVGPRIPKRACTLTP